MGDLGSIPGLRRSPGEGKGYPLQYSGLENSVDFTEESDTTEQLSLHAYQLHLFAYKYTEMKLKGFLRNM